MPGGQKCQEVVDGDTRDSEYGVFVVVLNTNAPNMANTYVRS